MLISKNQLATMEDPLSLPCFSFSGSLFDQHGKPISSARFRDIFGPAARRFVQPILAVAPGFDLGTQYESLVEVPRISFSVELNANAFSVPSADLVQVNFGMYLALQQLPRSIEWITTTIKANQRIDIDWLAAIAVPAAVVAELEGVLEIWDEFYRTGGIHLGRWSERFAADFADETSRTVDRMMHFVTFHEFAHWVGPRLVEERHEKMCAMVGSRLLEWINESFEARNARGALAKQFRAHPSMFDKWVEEVHADLLGMQLCLDYFPKYFETDYGPETLRDAYVAQAIFFSLVGYLSEAYFDAIRRQPLPPDTHPPASMRGHIYCYAAGPILWRMSPLEFETQVWGAGLAATAMSQAAATVLLAKLGMPAPGGLELGEVPNVIE